MSIKPRLCLSALLVARIRGSGGLRHEFLHLLADTCARYAVAATTVPVGQ